MNVSSSSDDNSRSCWTTVKWISQVSDSTISETQPSTPLILPGSVANTAVVNSVGGLYYYLPAFAYCKSSSGPGKMPQTLVYSNNVTLNDSKNIKLTVPGYYEVTVVANCNNNQTVLYLSISQITNGTTVKFDSSNSSSQVFAQNSLTVILNVDTNPSEIVVNLSTNDQGKDKSRTCWTSVKWISM